MKKVFASAVAAALALSMAVPAFAADTGSFTLSADKTELKAGDEFSVAIDLEGVEDLLNLPEVAGTGLLGAGDFNIIYDPEVLEIAKDIRGNPKFTLDSFITENLIYAGSANSFEAGTVSIQFFDQYAQGWGQDFTLGTLGFKVKDGVADGTETTISLVLPEEGDALVTAGASLEAGDEGVLIPDEELTVNNATVTIVGEPEPETSDAPAPETSDAPAPETSDAPAPDSDSTDSGKDSGTTTGGAGTTTSGSGSGTVKPGSDNNKTGDAGVLAIGGLMVLAAGATMLTLKKKSK